MNSKLATIVILFMLALLISSGASAEFNRDSKIPAPSLAPIGTSFTYQGSLIDGGSPANGAYDFEFWLYDDAVVGGQVGSTITLQDVTVADGIFTVTLDFGSVLDGTALWLEIRVRPGASTGGYQQLLPRQQLTTTPYASYAYGAPWGGLSGIPAGFADAVDDDTTYSAGDGLDLAGSQFSADFAGSGIASTIAHSDHQHVGDFWMGNRSGFILNIYNSHWSGTGVNVNSDGSGGIGVSAFGGGMGVSGSTFTGKGVYGTATHGIFENFGVYGTTTSSGGYGGMFVNTGGGALLAADNDGNHSDLRFRVSNVGNVFADGSFTGGGADFAELLDCQAGLGPGDVVCAGSDGVATYCSTAFDTTVLGVYSTDPGFVAGGGDSDVDREGKAPIAMMGFVPVKASAENGPIQIGDMLVSASTPGYAMHCEGIEACFGRTIGKALEPLATDTGLIQMLVMLR